MKVPFRYLLLAVLAEGSQEEQVILDTKSGSLLRIESASISECNLPVWCDLENLHALPDPDPARPDQREAGRLAVIARQPKRREILKLLEQVKASMKMPPLGIAGPSVSYSRFDGTRPSIAILELIDPILTEDSVLLFNWGETQQRLPLAKSLGSSIGHTGPLATKKQWQKAIGFLPRYAVSLYAPPQKGYLKKVIAALY
jgi:hypothetical protein